MKIDQIKLNPNNPRIIKDVKFKKLVKSLKEDPEMIKARPVVIDDGVVLGGNMRLRAATEAGIKNVPVYDATDWSDEEKKRFIVKDNLSYGEWDYDLLADQYDLDELSEMGMDIPEDMLPVEEIEEDEAPEVQDNPESKLGEVYQLGRHRLMCGDSTKIDDVEKLMDGKKADMVFTDPPYGVDYSSRVDKDKRKPWGGIINDDLQGESLREFLYDSCNHLEQPKYICCNWQSVVDFMLALGKPNAFIVWDKGSIGLGAGYRNQHEIILFYGTLDHNSESNVWTIKRDSSSSYNHPTQKPVAISSRAIKNSSKKGQIVVDVFGGSGSTLIACEQTDRTCYMSELDEKYVDVIRKRYWKFVNGTEDGWEEGTPAV